VWRPVRENNMGIVRMSGKMKVVGNVRVKGKMLGKS
jgi:hypothetical protein